MATTGGPSSVGGQLVEDEVELEPVVCIPWLDDALEPWFTWKQGLRERHGLRFGLDYTTLYQRASDSLTDDRYGWSGIARLYGLWSILGRGTRATRSLVASVDYRHHIGSHLIPAELGPVAAGYAGQRGVLFNDVGLVLVDLNWQLNLASREHPELFAEDERSRRGTPRTYD